MLRPRLTTSTRLVLLASAVLALGVLAAAVPGVRESLPWWGPLLGLAALMLAGIRPDELVERLVRRTRARGAARRPVRSIGTPRRPATVLARSGLLLARGLATRPPPAAPAAA